MHVFKEMMMAMIDETFVPTEADIEKAKEFSRQMARKFGNAPQMTIQKAGGGESIEVPQPVFHLLMKMLGILSEGKPFTLMPMDRELTTQQAADILNVSRPYVSKILDLGEIPHRKVGRNRRIKFCDLMEYKAKQEQRSEAALEALAEEAQELDLGY